MAEVSLQKVEKRYGAHVVVPSLDLTIADGEFTVLVGPSGCGKTTTLQMIAGLESISAGKLTIGGRDCTDLAPKERDIAMVFQSYALFPHMSVRDNINFGLKIRRTPASEMERIVAEVAARLKIDSYLDRLPKALSGGQRQRVALARALAVEPRVLLLDEPFGALDAKVRKELRRWLRELHDELHITTIFVTHDQEEALEVADRVVVMNAGRIEQVGAPAAVYDTPATPFVCSFLGNVNLFHGRIQNGQVDLGALRLTAFDHLNTADAPVVAAVRPHDLVITRDREGAYAIEVKVKHIQAIGPLTRVELQRTDNQELLEAELTRPVALALALQPGEVVYVTPQNLRVFSPDI